MIGPMKLDAKLLKLSADRGWQQKEVARRMGVPTTTVNSWFKGTSRPSQKNLIVLARVLGVAAEFLGDDARDFADPSASGLTEDDHFLLRTFHALEIPADEAVRRLAYPSESVRTRPVKPPQENPGA